MNDAAFVGSIPEHYDQGLGPILFTHYAADTARRVGDFLLAPHDGDLNIGKARCAQPFLDRIDLMAGERHVVELRRVDGKELSRRFVRDPAVGIVPMRIPHAEEVASARRE
jgi:hypothetical protein